MKTWEIAFTGAESRRKRIGRFIWQPQGRFSARKSHFREWGPKISERKKKSSRGDSDKTISSFGLFFFSIFFRHPQDSSSWNVAQGKHFFGEFSEQRHSPILFATTVVVHNEVRVSAISDNPKREVALLCTELVMWLVPEWATIDDITSNLEIQKKFPPSKKKKNAVISTHDFGKQIKFANVIGTSSKKGGKKRAFNHS